MIPLVHKFTTVILADGNYPTHPLPLSVLAQAERIVCCDGAAVHLIRQGIKPSYIVGDMDSLPQDLMEEYAAIIHRDKDQETNDMTKAIHFCRRHAWKELTIIGASGKREDHSLANLSLLADYSEYMTVQLLTDYGVFVAQSQTAEYESFQGQQVSIFSLSPETRLSTDNLVYPIVNRKLTSWWQGTLNESAGAVFRIEMDCGKLLVFRTYSD